MNLDAKIPSGPLERKWDKARQDFKLVNPQRRTYSVRIGIHYRALGLRNADEVLWYWIGRHDEYERLIP